MPMFFEHQDLVQAPPVRRAAYSDRTAWIMAELSRLVYERLPHEEEVEELLDKLINALQDGKAKKPELRSMVADMAGNIDKPRKSQTEATLKRQRFELINSHSVEGTEVMVVKIPPNRDVNFPGMFVIVFRGTEVTSIADLKADLDTFLVDAPGGGRVHRGFFKAYQKVDELLKADLEKAGDLPVYITGHSLGGALALVATRYIGSDSVGATYTFGGPRVGDDAFFANIKTPVYRVVNAADGVARIPFGAGFTILLSIIRIIPCNGTKKFSEFLRRNFNGFTHYGDMKMLTHPKGKKEVSLLSSPTIFKAGLQVVFSRMMKTFGKAALSDHYMTGYCEKLADYAMRRTNQ